MFHAQKAKTLDLVIDLPADEEALVRRMYIKERYLSL